MTEDDGTGRGGDGAGDRTGACARPGAAYRARRCAISNRWLVEARMASANGQDNWVQVADCGAWDASDAACGSDPAQWAGLIAAALDAEHRAGATPAPEPAAAGSAGSAGSRASLVEGWISAELATACRSGDTRRQSTLHHLARILSDAFPGEVDYPRIVAGRA